MVSCYRIIITFVLSLFLFSCNDSVKLTILEDVKSKGDTDPIAALHILDSLRPQMKDCDEYIRMKYVLLDMRLRDKAYLIPESDDSAKMIVAYFENNGTFADKQEAYYYAGSVYRDLNDTPQALAYFQNSVNIAFSGNECDSLLLRNTYSNIGHLHFNVQNYSDALDMALKEYNISKKLNRVTINSLIHLSEVYIKFDSLVQAENYLCEASKLMDNNSPLDAYSLLYNLSYVGNTPKADSIYNIVRSNDFRPDALGNLALAQYYINHNEMDSATACYERIIADSTELIHSYDAARYLFYIYRKNGNKEKSIKYAELFMSYSDTLDFGKRQELAATVNNQYKYNRDKEEENRIIKENTKYRKRITLLIVAGAILSFFYVILHLYSRNKHLAELIALSSCLENSKSEKERLSGELTRTQSELEGTRINLTKVNKELEKVTEEIATVENELAYKERLLLEKQEENKRIVSMLHKAELEENAADVINAIKNASEGRYKMTTAEWHKFYHAVDQQQPELMEKIMHHLGKFTEQQQQVCYLLSIGLTNTQIENLTDIPHVTVWRWVKRFDWIL